LQLSSSFRGFCAAELQQRSGGAVLERSADLIEYNVRLVDDVAPGKPEHDPAVGNQSGVTLAVSLECNFVAVEREAIEFDHNSSIHVAEIDHEEATPCSYPTMHLETRHRAFSKEPGEQGFELGVRHLPVDKPTIEHGAQHAEAAATLAAAFGSPANDRRYARRLPSYEVVKACFDYSLRRHTTKLAQRL
jgi:hypothetical protein